MKLEELAEKLDQLKIYWEEEDIPYDDRFNELLFFVEKTLTNELLWVPDDHLW